MADPGLSPMLLMVCDECRHGVNNGRRCEIDGCVFADCETGPYVAHEVKPARTREEMIAAGRAAVLHTNGRSPDADGIAHDAWGKPMDAENHHSERIAEAVLIAAGVLQSEGDRDGE